MNALDTIKTRAGQKIAESVVGYIRNGKTNERLDNLFKIAKIITSRPCDRRLLEIFRMNLQKDNSPQMDLLDRVLSKDKQWVQKALLNFFVNSLVVGRRKTLELEKKHSMTLPFFLLIDPTERCNYRCKGCWAGNFYGEDMPYDLFDSILTQAKEMGIYFVTISGGEPTLYPHLFDIMKKHDDMSFHFYTNGSMLAREEFADKFAEAGNGFPCISVEGFRDKTNARRGEKAWDNVMKAIHNLNEREIGFGISCTATRHSYQEITSDEFMDFMVDKGVLLAWYFMYMPIGRDPDFSMMLTPKMRRHMWKRTNEIRHSKPIVVADFWNDGPVTDGCLAAGKRYLHITSDGSVEPCAFVHFRNRDDNVRDKSLLEVLKTSKLFKAMMEKQNPAYEGNPMRPCWIVDRPWKLREVVRKSGASVSEQGSQPLLDPSIYSEIDKRARKWEPIANQIWDSIVEYNKKYTHLTGMVDSENKG